MCLPPNGRFYARGDQINAFMADFEQDLGQHVYVVSLEKDGGRVKERVVDDRSVAAWELGMGEGCHGGKGGCVWATVIRSTYRREGEEPQSLFSRLKHKKEGHDGDEEEDD